MRRLVVIAVVMSCIVFQAPLGARGAKRYLSKESTVDMKNMNRIFLGWVDLVPDDWALHGYSARAEWTDAVNTLNYALLRSCQTTYLGDRTVTAAKEKGDENTEDSDLYIKFSDVRIDYDNYYLYVAIHFIDPKTKAELASIPVRPYYGNDWGFVKYLRAALDEVNVKLQVEILGGVQKKKK
jgi:hypothetical protein